MQTSYTTKQRKALLQYLERHPDELLTAHEIAAALQSLPFCAGHGGEAKAPCLLHDFCAACKH